MRALRRRHLPLVTLILFGVSCGGVTDPPLDVDAAADCDACLADIDAGASIDGGGGDAGGWDAGVDAEVEDDCDPDGPIHPGAEEVIDGIDNDCDGMIDEVTVCPGSSTYLTIGAGIAAAPDGGIVFVCAGTYPERIAIAGKALQLIGVDGASVTIIDGQSAGSVVTVGAGADLTMRGFTVQHGAAGAGGGLACDHARVAIDDVGFVDNVAATRGGGASLAACEGTVQHSRFVGNRAVHGGGLAIAVGLVSVIDNAIENNAAELQGGGIFHSSDGTISGNLIRGNSAGWTSGGVHVDEHHALITDNTIEGNRATNDGGGIYFHRSSGALRANRIRANVSGDDGGGIRLFESAMMVEANLVEGNTATDGGGGMRLSHVPAILVGNIIRDNTAGGTGGGIDMDNDASTVIGGQITGNRAGGSGGGIFHWLGPWNGAVLVGIRIADNRAWRGGGIFLDDNLMPVTMRELVVVDNHASLGAGLMVRATDYVVRNSVFARNIGDRGGAIYAGINSASSAWTEPCPPCPPTEPVGRIEFSAFHGNRAGEGAGLWIDTDRVTVASSIFSENEGPAVTVAMPVRGPAVLTPPVWIYNDTWPAEFDGMPDPSGQSGNLSVAPQFVDPVGDDFQLEPSSACVDAGDPGYQDPDGSRADMGAFGARP